MPVYARASQSSEAIKALRDVVTFQFLIVAFLGMAAATLGPPTLLLLVPPSYWEAATFVPLLCLGAVLFGWYFVPMDSIVLIEGRTRSLFVWTLIAAATNVALNVYSSLDYGAIVAAASTAVGYGLLFLLVLAYSRRGTARTSAVRMAPDCRWCGSDVGPVCGHHDCYTACGRHHGPVLANPRGAAGLVDSRRGVASTKRPSAAVNRVTSANRPPGMLPSPPSVTLVVRCLNEERHIGRLLTGVMRQTVTPAQIVIVDSGSTDATFAIAGRFGVEITTIEPSRFSFGRALNLGCAAATRRHHRHRQRPRVPAVRLVARGARPRRSRAPRSPWLMAARSATTRRTTRSDRSCVAGSRMTSDADQAHPFCNNANAAIRRSAWESHPYDEELTGLEDMAWANAGLERGERIAYVAEAPVVHVHRERWASSRTATGARRSRTGGSCTSSGWGGSKRSVWHSRISPATTCMRRGSASWSGMSWRSRGSDPPSSSGPTKGSPSAATSRRSCADVSTIRTACADRSRGRSQRRVLVVRSITTRSPPMRADRRVRDPSTGGPRADARHGASGSRARTTASWAADRSTTTSSRRCWRVPSVDHVVIDTDSAWITDDAATAFPDVTVLERPAHLRDGSTPMNDVLLHDVEQVPADLYLQTHSTNPLLRSETIERAIAHLHASRATADSLFGVTRLQTRLWTAEGRPLNHDPDVLFRTQDLPPVYEENSCIYLFDGETLRRRRNRLGERPMLFEIPRGGRWTSTRRSTGRSSPARGIATRMSRASGPDHLSAGSGDVGQRTSSACGPGPGVVAAPTSCSS